MKTKYAIPIALGVLLIILVVVFWQDVKALFVKATMAGSGTLSSGSGSSASVFPLRRGSTGEEVKKLQAFLNGQRSHAISQGKSVDLAELIVDGIFGSKTEAMLVEILNLTSVTKDFYDNSINI
jgi:hypothetical protein